MNLILVTRRHGVARQVNLQHPVNLLLVVLGLGLVLAAAFSLGRVSGLISAGGPEEQLAAWRAELDTQEQLLEETRKVSREKIDALSVKLAQMNAQVIRLEALGRRLTQMADLDDGEFDFDSSPALGGPEPEAPGRSVAMPDMEFLLDTLAMQIQDRHRQLDILEDLMLNRTLSDEVHPEGRPVTAGWISSYYGMRTDPFTGKATRHKGVDFAGKEGAEVIAVAAGVVTWSGDRFGYGEMVEINHGNGFSTRYAHNSKNLVAVGDQVSKGQVVSLMGRTGRATGPNLHFEVMRGGRKVDPLEYIRGTR
ncbi:MAG: M23 family metallopeptidase [Proteobacteria bacterium]|nr:M23 family metallopeptidase [Pseudomonadota bacterium]MCH9026256.1 M23 family metallopeptidase [Pseudomonadota bacterium]